MVCASFFEDEFHCFESISISQITFVGHAHVFIFENAFDDWSSKTDEEICSKILFCVPRF